MRYLEAVYKRGFWLVLLAWMFIVFAIKIQFGERYTMDSYAFYLLGKNIIEGNGFYSPSIRDFYLDPSGPLVSRSFPPLFPLLVGITDFFLNESIAAGQVLNLYICILALYLWFIISKRISTYLFFIPFLVPIIYSAIFPLSLWIEATAGRAVSLAWLLLLALLYLLSKPSLLTENKISIGAGIFLGLLALSRFDTMLFCFALPAVIYCATKISIKKVLLIYFTLIVVMLPWSIRNFIVFGSFFASDNTLTVSSTMAGVLQLNFFDYPIPSGADNPSLWINQRLGYLKFNSGFFYSLLSAVNQQAIAFLYLSGFIYAFIFKKENYSLWIYFVVSLTWAVLNVICVSLTPYGQDPRYYAVSGFMVVGGSAFFVASIIHRVVSILSTKTTLSTSESPRVSTIIIELCICLILVFSTIQLYSKDIYYNKNDYWWPWTQHIENAPVKKGEYVACDSAELISFYTGWNTIYLPGNKPIYDKNYQAWLKHWKPTYLLVDLYDFNNALAVYPHATASTILDTVVLLKINHDEAALTEQDASNNAKVRDLWKQHIHSKISPTFFADHHDPNYSKGAAITWGGFFVQNTPEHQLKFAQGRVVLLPNGEQRLINETNFDRTHLFVKVMGESFANQFPDLPDTFKTIEDNPFFVTNETWRRGLAIKEAGFYVPNTPQNLNQYKEGHIVQLPTGDERTITKVVIDASIITVTLSGDPIDGYKVGTPDQFKVRRK